VANPLDTLIGFFSPKAGLGRMVARERMRNLRSVEMQYNAASRGRRTNSWRPNSAGAISEVSMARDRLRFVGRDLVRNNPIAARVPMLVSQNVVGKGIIPNAVTSNAADKEKVEGWLKRHFDTPACDYNGQLDLYGLQQLIVKLLPSDGECFVIKHFMAPDPGQHVLPLRLQVLEADYLDTTKQTLTNKNNRSRIINGIQFDRRGRREGYWLFDEHPGDVIHGRHRQSRFYPASRVCHVYRIDRPGQINGASWFAPVAVKLADLHEFGDARLYREKIAGAFVAFIKRNEESTAGITGNSKNGGHANYPLEEITPGLIEHLEPGDEVSFGDPPQTAGYKEFWSSEALEISMGIGISYAALTGDMSMGNFSSNRMGWLEDQRFYESIRSGAITGQFLHPLTGWTIQAIHACDRLGEFSLNWTPQARDMIDPSRDVTALEKAITAGFRSEQETIRERGRDPEDVHKEKLEDARRKRELERVMKHDK
jgi:lambda family phage portal protein